MAAPCDIINGRRFMTLLAEHSVEECSSNTEVSIMRRTPKQSRRSKRRIRAQKAKNMPFELIDGKMVPRLPRAVDGTERRADGVRFFSPAQVAKRTGRSEADLVLDWKLTWSDLLPSGEEEPVSDSPPDAILVRRGMHVNDTRAGQTAIVLLTLPEY